MNAIVLDGNQRSALAVVRSLGKRGVTVIVGEDRDQSLASSSRYCADSFTYHSPKTDPDLFVKDVQKSFKSSEKSILMPMTDITLGELLIHKDTLGSNITVPFPDIETYHSATDKITLFKIAESLSIPIPKTLFSSDYPDLSLIAKEVRTFRFPLVLKTARSRIKTMNGWIDGGVTYANCDESLNDKLRDEPFRSYPFLIQEKIEGNGLGTFFLMKDGQVLVRFAHKRIREKPPSGGVSTLCESIEPPAEAYESAMRLLTHLGWTGVAMVEFKLDRRDNRPKLMEINGRFWGSLQLAIESGVDFPYLLYRLAKGDWKRGPEKYRVGVKSRWELGDLDHLLIRLNKRNADNRYLPQDAPSIGKVVKEYLLDFFSPSVKHEIFKFNDLGPFRFELKEYVKNLRN